MARILVTDDAQFMRSILGNILRRNGYDVVEACNGEEAIDKALSGNFDLVTLDITMPVLDGLSALKAIKSTKPEQKVIMVSAMGQKAMVTEAVKAGAVDFIVKPFKADKVLKAVSKVLK